MINSRHHHSRSVRSAALAAAGMLALSVLPALPAAAADGTPYDHESACLDAPPTDRFNDRPTTAGREQTNVDCASRYVDSSNNILLAGAPDGLSPEGEPRFKANLGNTSSRAQFAKILNVLGRLANIDAVKDRDGKQNTFPDVAQMGSEELKAEIQGAWQKGLMNGTNQKDREDVDGDGDREELLFDPNGTIPYTQAVQAVVNLLERAEGKELSSTADGKNSSSGGLDCRFAQPALERLVNNSVIHVGPSIVPADCTDKATRGQVYDLFLSAASYLIDKAEMTKATFPEPEPPAGPAIDPTEAGVLDVSTDSSSTGVRTFTATGLDPEKKYDLALFPKASLSFDEDGDASFKDEDEDNFADHQGDTVAYLKTVNGATQGGNKQAFDTSPINGQITIGVDSKFFDEVYLVMWWDTGTTTNDKLDLVKPTTANALPKLPKDMTLIGGLTTWIPEEAEDDTRFLGGPIQYVDKTNDFFVAGGKKFRYKQDDTFEYDGTKTGLSVFESALSVLDQMDAGTSYTYRRVLGSTVNLKFDRADKPTGLTATTGDLDGQGDFKDVKFDWAAPVPPNGLIEKYGVEVRKDTSSSGASPCSSTTSYRYEETTDASTTLTFLDVEDGAYCASVKTWSQTNLSSDPTEFISFRVGEVDTTPPTIADLRMFEDNGNAGQVDVGDVIRIQFSESMKDITAGSEIRFIDNDGQTYKLVLSESDSDTVDGEATFTQTDYTKDTMTYKKGQLTLTLVDLPVKLAGPGDDDIANLNATITQIKKGDDPAALDLQGNPLDIPGSPDKIIDNE